MKKFLLVTLILMLVAAMVLSGCGTKTTPTMTQSSPYSPTYLPTTIPQTVPKYTQATQTPGGYYPTTIPNTTTIGLAAGGAKDVVNFRANIQHNYLPLPTDITYEGLFYDYYFDTGLSEACRKLYCPSYSYAITRDPFSHKTEYYLSVGLNSGLKESDFQRKKLNLVIVLDTSGSMGENYTQYYYDRYGKQIDAYEGEGISRQNKMTSAAEAVVAILDQLNNDDRFAVVLFNSDASLAKPMGLVSKTNIRDIANRILDITAGGSTNLSAGIELATGQFRNLYEINNYEYENRIIVLTDAQPNTGDTTVSGYMNILRNNANSRIYTTFIGIGVDFNSQLIEQITGMKGANYYSVHSPREFRGRVADEFEFMVTPLIFNLQLNFESNGWRIEKVFGSPEADEATGKLMRINTLFPSKSEGGENKGGLVLLKLRKTSSLSDEKVYLKVSYEDRNGRTDSSVAVIALESQQPEYFDNSGIRKGILLARYASLLKNWLIDERQHVNYNNPWNPIVREDTGIMLPSENISQWERQSLPLVVSSPYRMIFRDFAGYFDREMNAINDYTLDQELAILKTLSAYR